MFIRGFSYSHIYNIVNLQWMKKLFIQHAKKKEKKKMKELSHDFVGILCC